MRILLDCDGVLSDFVGHAINTIEVLRATGYTSENFPTWNVAGVLDPEEQEIAKDVFSSPGWCDAMPAYPGAREAVDRLRLLGEVYFVTAPYPSESWMPERAAWLEREMGATPRDWVLTHAKHLCVGDAFVDDKLENVVKWHQHHPKALAVLWDSIGVPLSGEDIPPGVLVTHDWDVLLTELTRRQR